MSNYFYTYTYLNPQKPGRYEYSEICFLFEPFYIGKGKMSTRNRDRCYEHLNSNSQYPFHRKIRKLLASGDSPIIIKLSWFIEETAAFDEEINLISQIGRRDKKFGPLLNLTDGGDGVSGARWNHTQKSKDKISRSKIGDKNPRYGLSPNHSIKTKNKIKNKLSMVWQIFPPGGDVVTVKNLKEYCSLNSLDNRKMGLVAQGKRNHHKGFRCKKVTI